MSANLRSITASREAELRALLNPKCFRPLSQHYLCEPRNMWHGKDGLVLAPATAEDAALILRFADDNRVPVVPFSGGTGLVGGQIAPDLERPIILSSERLTRVRNIYPDENVMVAEAGVILQKARQAADDIDQLFPLMLASEGSCRIGGNLATNAGGMNVLRYGNTRDLCLGLEAVLPGGRIIHGLKRLRKDNTGYDMRNLLIGSEGTLGFITAASLRLFAKPAERAIALLEVDSPSGALDLLNRAQEKAAGMLSVFEMISGAGFDFIRETMPDVRFPFAKAPVWSVLIEIGTPAGIDAMDLLSEVYEDGSNAGLILDGVMAQSDRQADDLINLRELIPEANKRVGSIASHDISLPLSSVSEFISLGQAQLKLLGPMRLNCFGHLGDGNLHFNLFPPKGERKADWVHMRQAISELVHDLVAKFDGSFSAEHGVGRLKVAELARYGDATRIEAMKAVKKAIDPKGIMNPGVLF